MVRIIIQVIAAILQNSYLPGFLTGSLYRGKLKSFCVPGLNCYSCPGALGACPIGSLQALALNPKLYLSLYIYGFIALVGTVAGRFVCGFLCPFGLMQELLHKIPIKKTGEREAFKTLNKMKYVVLLVLVIGIPTILTHSSGMGFAAFCQWLCPAGTLQAGIPLVLLNDRIRSAVGLLFLWKVAILLFLMILSAKLFRPFCRFICPLGALYSLFNRVSVIHIGTDRDRCNNCDNCTKTCPMRASSPDSTECIRCGECVKSCPGKALRWKARRESKVEIILEDLKEGQ